MNFNLKDTLQSGQCFRFSEQNGSFVVYSGVDSNFHFGVFSQDAEINDPYWRNYFDLDTNYEEIKAYLEKKSKVMKKAIDYAPGIRILNQDPWEALCSFVVSQNNNIPRIKSIIGKMCTAFGKDNAFPSSNTLAGASEESLKKTGLGFRSQYIINTAVSVEEGKINFQMLRNVNIDEARKILMQVKGIGPKVANCALLFGLHRLDCFPIDTWMSKVMSAYFPGCDPNALFGPYAGIAQQYLFHWARNGGVKNDF